VYSVSARAGGKALVVETARVRLQYTPDGRAPHAGNMHALIAHESPPPGVAMRDGRVLWTPESRNLFNLGGTLETLDGVRGAVDTGVGLLARDGWSLVDDSFQHLLIDDWAQTRESVGLAGNLDWYLFAYGADYAAGLRALATIAGRVPIPRRYALGSWYSRYWPYTSAEFRGIVLEYRTHGFPLDVMVLDMDWHKDGWTGWSWNRQLLPDAEDLLAWLHEEGLAVTLNLHPADGVGGHEDAYGAFMRALGREPSGERVAFDAGDRRYAKALFDQVHRPLEVPEKHGARAGVDFWWLDWQQDRFVRSIPGLTNLRWLNQLYFQHTSERGARGLSFSRWAGWGDHRHPIHFSGDAHTGWRMLAFQVPFTVQAGNVGCFYWSHDIGGHFGPRLEETTTRWVQFGALSAALRLHSARSGVLDRRPWTYPPKFAESMRRAFELRGRLMPYIYTAARASYDQTLPLLRPMYLACGCDQRSYETPQQYLLGEDILVAPIVSPGVGERCVATQRVWFPCGCGEEAELSPDSDPDPARLAIPEHAAESDAWFDLLTGEHHHAGHEVIVAADIDHVPVFVRAGVPMPMQSPGQRMTGQIESLIVRLFPGHTGSEHARELYEDDGVSDAYQHDGCARTRLIARWLDAPDVGTGDRRELELRIGPSEGRFDHQPAVRSLVVELGGVAWTGNASVDGQAVHIEHDASEAGGLARIVIDPSADIRRARTVRVQFEAVDRAAVVERVRRANLAASLGEPLLGGVLKHSVVNAASQAQGAEAVARALAIGAGIAITPTDGHARFVDSLALIDRGEVSVTMIDRVGPHDREIARSVLNLHGGPGARAATLDIPSTPLPGAPLGTRAQRLIRAKFSIDRAAMVLDVPVRSVLAPLSKCVVAAPFDWDWRWGIDEHRFEPETMPLDARASYRGADGRRVGWLQGRGGQRWQVDFMLASPDRRALGFAWTRIAQSARLHIESAGDKTQVFINGELVFNQNGFDSQAAALEWVDVKLRAGKNDILVKSAEGGGGWGVTLAVECEGAIMEHSPL
jgi:Glycosyl hydrolases family 31/Domain of unknown function (DUF5110)